MSRNQGDVMQNVADVLGRDIVLELGEFTDEEDYQIADPLEGQTIGQIKQDQRELAGVAGGSHAYNLITRSGRECNWQPGRDYEIEDTATPVPDFAALDGAAQDQALLIVRGVAMRELDYYQAKRLRETLVSINKMAYVDTFIEVMKRYWPQEAARIISTQM